MTPLHGARRASSTPHTVEVAARRRRAAPHHERGLPRRHRVQAVPARRTSRSTTRTSTTRTPILQIDRLPKTMAHRRRRASSAASTRRCSRRCTSKVTLVEGRPQLLPFLDAEMGERLRGAMQSARGRRSTSDEHGEERPRGSRAAGSSRRSRAASEIAAEKLLAARAEPADRRARARARSASQVDKRGYVQVDGDYRTAVPSIYARATSSASRRSRRRRWSRRASRSATPSASPTSGRSRTSCRSASTRSPR